MEGLYGTKRYDEAKAVARRILLKNKYQQSAWMCLMEIARKTHNKTDAEEAMKNISALKLDASQSMVFGFSGLAAGMGNNALPALKRALDSSPEDADIVLNARDPQDEAELAARSGATKIKRQSAK